MSGRRALWVSDLTFIAIPRSFRYLRHDHRGAILVSTGLSGLPGLDGRSETPLRSAWSCPAQAFPAGRFYFQLQAAAGILGKLLSGGKRKCQTMHALRQGWAEENFWVAHYPLRQSAPRRMLESSSLLPRKLTRKAV